MAQTIQFTPEQLRSLASVLDGYPQARTLESAANAIHLVFSVSEVVSEKPPALTLPQRIASITIGSTRYTSSREWTTAWYDTYTANKIRGLSVVDSVLISSTNIANALGTALVNVNLSATTVSNTVTTTAGVSPTTVYVAGPKGVTGAVGDQGVPGPAGRSITTIEVDPQGYLQAVFSDGTQQTAGYVVGPSPSLSIGTVTTVAYGTGSSASLQGISPNFTLDLTLETGPTDPAAVLTTGSYTDPAWLTLTPTKVGLDTQANMFTNPNFTGTATVNSQPIATQASIIALGLAF